MAATVLLRAVRDAEIRGFRQGHRTGYWLHISLPPSTTKGRYRWL